MKQTIVELRTCSVFIIEDENGVSVDIYPLDDFVEPAASCYARKADLEPIEENIDDVS